MEFKFERAVVERQASIAISTVLVALIGYIYGRLLSRLIGEDSAWLSIIQIAMVGVSREYVETILRRIGYADDVVAQSMPIYTVATLFGQPDVFRRFGSLISAAI